ARNYEEITRRLGETWEISLNTYKPFACGIVEHPAIDGCIQLRNEHKLKGEEIEAITLRSHPLVLELTGKKTPQTGLEGEFSDAVVRDKKVIALRDKVTATVDKAMHEDQVHVTIKLKNGKTLEKYVEHCVGSLGRPMSDADLEAKFR